MKRKQWGLAAALVLVLAVSFCVRALPAFLPSVSEELRPVLQDEDGDPYLTEMDSYFYARFAREMAEAGAPFQYNRRSEDPLMGQRYTVDSGQGIPVLLSVLAYYVWRFLSLFFNVRVIQVVRWMGPVMGSLAAVPVFFYVRRRTNIWGGITAALLVGLSLPFVSHTHAGFFDTDMLLAIVPLGFLLLELRAMQEKDFLRQLVPGVFSGILLGLLSLIWFAFYTYFWLMVLGGLLGILLIMAAAGRCPFRRRITVVRGWLVSVASALLFVFLFRGQPGMQSLLSVISVFRSVSGSTNVFPFTHQFTGEMQPLALLPDGSAQGILSLFRADLSSGLGCLGGLLPCILALLAFPLAVFFAYRKKETPEKAQRYDSLIALMSEAGILLLWLGFGVVLMRSRRRFTEISALPVALLAGLGVGFAVRLLKPLKAGWRAAAGAVLAAVVCLPMGAGAVRYARTALPSAADSMAAAMDYILETQPEDAAIASWWDYGYFMQYASRRRAITDGGTSSGATYYYLAKALMTDDPAEMAGIFRMLETSALSALSDLERAGIPQAEAAEYLLRIAGMSREEAAKTEPLASFSPEQRTAVLDKTHPREKKPLLLVLSADMLNKTGVFAFYGMWDPAAMKQTEEVYWDAGSASRVLSPGGAAVFEMQKSAALLTAQMNENGYVTATEVSGGNIYDLSRLCVWRNGVKVQDTNLGGSGPAVILAEENGRMSAFTCSPNLCGSMFVRLYVCGDRTVPGMKLLGTWFGRQGSDPGIVQHRLNTDDLSIWGVQVWEVAE